MMAAAATGDPWTVVAAVVAAVAVMGAAGVAAWVTRKNAKDSQLRTDQLAAGELYVALTNDQRIDLTAYREEVARLREVREEVYALRGWKQRMVDAARVHMRWDETLVAEVNKIPGVHVAEPPPLLPEPE